MRRRELRMPARCKHENARAVTDEPKYIDAECPDCRQGWRGRKHEWWSSRGIHHRPPAWVRRLVELLEKKEGS